MYDVTLEIEDADNPLQKYSKWTIFNSTNTENLYQFLNWSDYGYYENLNAAAYSPASQKILSYGPYEYLESAGGRRRTGPHSDW